MAAPKVRSSLSQVTIGYRFTLDHTLRAPGNGVSYNAKSDNFNYSGPLDVYYKNKKVHSYKALVAVSNGNWAVVTAYAQ